jgi:hypothetical protein
MRVKEPSRIGRLAIIETVRLFVAVAIKTERFDRHVGAFDGALQEAPEVLQTVAVNRSVHVRLTQTCGLFA